MNFWSATDAKKIYASEVFTTFRALIQPKISLDLLNLKHDNISSYKIHCNCGYPFDGKYSLFKIAPRITFFTKYVSLTWHSASPSLLQLISKYFQNQIKSICFLQKIIDKSKVVPKEKGNSFHFFVTSKTIVYCLFQLNLRQVKTNHSNQIIPFESKW